MIHSTGARALAVALCVLFQLLTGVAQAELGDIKLIKSYQALTDSEGEVNEHFGGAVAIDGSRMIVGAPYDSTPAGTNAGSVFVFERDDAGNWVQVAKLTDSDGAASDYFGSAVALSGDRIVVGAYQDDTAAAPDAGSISVFERNDAGSWLQVAKLTDPNANQYCYLGWSVSLSGDRIGVGSRFGNAGHAWIFKRYDSGEWKKSAELKESDSEDWSAFGSSVSLSGDRIVVGDVYDDEVDAGIYGSATVFERDSAGDWLRVAKLTGTSNDYYFGRAVSLSGDRIAVGASPDLEDYGGSGSYAPGSVSLFERDGSGTWNVISRLTDVNATASNHFGEAVALRDDRVLIGARYSSTVAGKLAGAAFVFERDELGNWIQVAKLTDGTGGAASNEFGYSVALSNTRSAVGVPNIETADGPYIGAAQVFTFADSGFDFGDAPAPYPTLKSQDGARHGIGSLWLGSGTPDKESDGLPEPEARGDDGDKANDEADIILSNSTVFVDAQTEIKVYVGGHSGLLDAWIDLNRDGDWADANERIANHQSVNPGSNIVYVHPGDGVSNGTSFARFRLSSAGVDAPTGEAADGEVVDVQIKLAKLGVKVPTAKSVTEGKSVNVKVSLTGALGYNLVVNFTTQNGTALAGQDYIAKSGSVIIPAGATSATIQLATISDTAPESDETFKLLLTSVPSVSILKGESLITILNDD